MGQERSLWADTLGELTLGQDLRRGRGLGEGQWEKTRDEKLGRDADRRMSWAYLHEPKY